MLDDAVAAEKGDVVGHKEEVVAVNDVVVEVDDAVVVPVVERATRGIEISGEWFDDVREVDPDVFFSWVSGGEVANQTSSENGTNETSDSYETDKTDPGWRRRRRRWLRGYVSPDSAESDISENERPKSGVVVVEVGREDVAGQTRAGCGGAGCGEVEAKQEVEVKAEETTSVTLVL